MMDRYVPELNYTMSLQIYPYDNVDMHPDQQTFIQETSYQSFYHTSCLI